MSFLAPFLVTLAFTPVFSRIARKMNVVDRPDGYLKIHTREVPYLGGLAMFLGASVVFWKDTSILLTASVLTSIGLLDDVFDLKPVVRLVVESSAGAFLAFRFFGGMEAILAVVFVVALVNAVNMVDGMDGMAAGGAAISAFYLFLVSENTLSTELSLAILGVSLGFLVYNFPPARVFMGDAGSYLLGVGLASIVLASARYGISLESLRFVYPVWMYLLDLICGVVRRMRAGKSPFSGDREHFYDKLRRKTKSDRLTLVLSYSMVAFFSSLSLVNEWLALVLALTGSLVVIKVLKLTSYDT